MIDLLHLPEPSERVVWFPGSAGTSDWKVWTKPRGVSMVAIIAIGGGGGGSSGGALSPPSGGGGGGGACMSAAMFNAFVLPETLYVSAGNGGAGGAATTTTSPKEGTIGGTSHVSVYPNTTAGNAILTAPGGRVSQFSGGSGGGAAATAATVTSNPLCQMALRFSFNSGSAGTAGRTTVGTNLAPGTIPILGGTGGGGNSAGISYSGGGIYGAGINIPNANGNGSPGFIFRGFHYGGTGGGGSTTQGGAGGNGGVWGAGGGGGGGCIGAGGAGGAGGPGLVIIASW